MLDDGDESLLCEQPEWADVTPITPARRLAAGALAACSLAVQPALPQVCEAPLSDHWQVSHRPSVSQPPHSRAQEAHAYFRAVLASGEVSARAHALSTRLIALNAADYTAWALRWRCVQAAAAAEVAEAQAAGLPPPTHSCGELWARAASALSLNCPRPQLWPPSCATQRRRRSVAPRTTSSGASAPLPHVAGSL